MESVVIGSKDTIERHGHSCSRDPTPLARHVRLPTSLHAFACLLLLKVAGLTVVAVRFLGALLRAPCAKSAAGAEDREFRAVLTLEFFKLRRGARG